MLSIQSDLRTWMKNATRMKQDVLAKGGWREGQRERGTLEGWGVAIEQVVRHMYMYATPPFVFQLWSHRAN